MTKTDQEPHIHEWGIRPHGPAHDPMPDKYPQVVPWCNTCGRLQPEVHEPRRTLYVHNLDGDHSDCPICNGAMAEWLLEPIPSHSVEAVPGLREALDGFIHAFESGDRDHLVNVWTVAQQRALALRSALSRSTPERTTCALHVHVAGTNGDACQDCGHDLRAECHERWPER